VYRQKQAAVAETLWRANPDDGASRNLALADKYVGGTLLVMGRAGEARDFYEKAVALDEKRAAASPAGSSTRLDLSFDYGGLGDCLSRSGDFRGSLEAYRRALAIREEVAAADPKNVFARSSVASAQRKIGWILEKSGDVGGALESQGKALAIERELASLDPSNSRPLLEVAATLGTMGELHANAAGAPHLTSAKRREHWTEARVLYQKSLDVLLELRRQGKLGADDAAETDRVAKEIARCDAALSDRKNGPG
jgi:tetratricopeptide (TPR) repeat protein